MARTIETDTGLEPLTFHHVLRPPGRRKIRPVQPGNRTAIARGSELSPPILAAASALL